MSKRTRSAENKPVKGQLTTVRGVTESKKNATYPAARAEAQRQANADGFDRGLEWNSVFKTWSCKMLPGKQYRFGYETRIEVVSCENIDKCRKGHGPI